MAARSKPNKREAVNSRPVSAAKGKNDTIRARVDAEIQRVAAVRLAQKEAAAANKSRAEFKQRADAKKAAFNIPFGTPRAKLGAVLGRLISAGVATQKLAPYDKVAAEVKRRTDLERQVADAPVLHPTVVAGDRAAQYTITASGSPEAKTPMAVGGPAAGAGMSANRAPTALGVRLEHTDPEVTRGVGRDYVGADGTAGRATFTVVKHREYMTDVTCKVVTAGTPTQFAAVQYDINPGNSQFAAWLATFAINYEQYHWERLRMSHVVESSTASAGRHGGMFDYNVTDGAPPNKVVFYSTTGAASAAVWQELGVELRRAPASYINSFFTGPVPAGGDPKMYSPATYNVMTADVLPSGAANGQVYTLSEVFVDYEIWLLEASLETTNVSSGGAAWTGFVTASNGVQPYNVCNAIAANTVTANVPALSMSANQANSGSIVLASSSSNVDIFTVYLPNLTATYAVWGVYAGASSGAAPLTTTGGGTTQWVGISSGTTATAVLTNACPAGNPPQIAASGVRSNASVFSFGDAKYGNNVQTTNCAVSGFALVHVTSGQSVASGSYVGVAFRADANTVTTSAPSTFTIFVQQVARQLISATSVAPKAVGTEVRHRLRTTPPQAPAARLLEQKQPPPANMGVQRPARPFQGAPSGAPLLDSDINRRLDYYSTDPGSAV